MTTLNEKDKIVQALIANIAKRTPSNIKNEGGFDFTAGAPLRAELEGVAIQVDSVKKDIFTVFDQERLNAMKIIARIDNNPATKASGAMDITSDTDFTLLAGTAVMSTSQAKAVASVISDVTFDGDPTPEMKTVQIIANNAGKDVSFAIGDLYFTASNLSGTNAATINNGKDAESDYELVQRIEIALLAMKEATVAAITAKALLVKLYDISGNITEYVLDVLMQFPWQTDPDPQLSDVGDIDLYVVSSLGSASSSLISAIETALLGSSSSEGVQAAGMDINVMTSPKENIAFIVGGVVVKAGYAFSTVQTNIQGAISDYVAGLKMGEAINPTAWQTAAGGAEGVDYFDETTLSPGTQQTLDAYKTWNVTGYTITEAP